MASWYCSTSRPPSTYSFFRLRGLRLHAFCSSATCTQTANHQAGWFGLGGGGQHLSSLQGCGGVWVGTTVTVCVYVAVCAYVCLCVCVCVCVCVLDYVWCERQTRQPHKTGRQTDRKKERDSDTTHLLLKQKPAAEKGSNRLQTPKASP